MVRVANIDVSLFIVFLRYGFVNSTARILWLSIKVFQFFLLMYSLNINYLFRKGEIAPT